MCSSELSLLLIFIHLVYQSYKMPKKYTNCNYLKMLIISCRFKDIKDSQETLRKREAYQRVSSRAASNRLLMIGWPPLASYFLLTWACFFRLRLIGTYGLKNKREVWRTQMTLAKLR
jgi:hypothetical protein